MQLFFFFFQRMLILCYEQKGESLEVFYARVLRFMHIILKQGAQLIATNDVIVKKGDLEMNVDSRKCTKQPGCTFSFHRQL